jgi:hypothetical protein
MDVSEDGEEYDREIKKKAARKAKRTAFRQHVNAARTTAINPDDNDQLDPDQTPTQKRKASGGNSNE